MAEEAIANKIEGAPEQSVERGLESSALEKKIEAAANKAAEVVNQVPNSKPIIQPIKALKTREQIRSEKIDQILSDGLSDIFMDLPPKTQMQFKVEGERTTRKINELLSEAKVKARKIVDLIMAWLGIIPGLNRFFLEQEAKIKTDQILKMKEEEK
jgi:hypothetical protein